MCIRDSQWLDDEETDYYFELRIQFDEITKDVSLIVTDFAEDEEEVEESKLLWTNQISDLKKVLGNQVYAKNEGAILESAITMNSGLVLFGIFGFIACFAFSLALSGYLFTFNLDSGVSTELILQD